MKYEELEATAEKWINEKDGRTIILIASEPSKDCESINHIKINGKKHALLLSLFEFMKKEIDLIKEATEIGSLNQLIGDILSQGPMVNDKEKKECADSLLKKILKQII